MVKDDLLRFVLRCLGKLVRVIVPACFRSVGEVYCKCREKLQTKGAGYMLLGGAGQYCVWENKETGERHLRNVGDNGECTVGGRYWFNKNYFHVATVDTKQRALEMLVKK